MDHAGNRQGIRQAVLDALEGELRDVIVEAAAQAFNRGDVTLTPKEAAKALGCGERFLLDGCNKYGFPYICLGKAKRFGPQELRQIQDMCRVPAQPSRLAKARAARRKN
ncbi:helix-turn-helix domain-containing protein [Streptomyces inhibens]|uniref:helix-turn-helix domain-containing protein n=1 Tax=Streptomyces inhibens TaxID=2293571 RepID=UPI001EE6BEEA|nr:helix-turn-helix domain-containing protein [Streptomyces inhibens]UKY54935.1 helix-turn-helix domain-containing protein [Streptomyces inhibens]